MPWSGTLRKSRFVDWFWAGLEPLWFFCDPSLGRALLGGGFLIGMEYVASLCCCCGWWCCWAPARANCAAPFWWPPVKNHIIWRVSINIERIKMYPHGSTQQFQLRIWTKLRIFLPLCCGWFLPPWLCGTPFLVGSGEKQKVHALKLNEQFFCHCWCSSFIYTSHVLDVFGSPSPNEIVRVFPPGLMTAKSLCPLWKTTTRMPPPPQPSFFTRNSSLHKTLVFIYVLHWNKSNAMNER